MTKLIPSPEMRGLVVLAGSSNIPFSLETFETTPYHFQGSTMFISLKKGLVTWRLKPWGFTQSKSNETSILMKIVT